MRQITEALEVSRSNIQEQLKTKNSTYSSAWSKDNGLLPLIRNIIDAKPTYGYRRVTAVLNLKLLEMRKSVVNHKRIYRIMKENNLLLAKYGRKKTLAHDGKIITLKSNTRWCSDSFSIQCFNGDRVHVAFEVDTCDIEVMSWIASTIYSEP
jgi:putative transposase